jgi:glutamate-5-semialdehyde dehydrogenase
LKTEEYAKLAKAASIKLSAIESETKNIALGKIASALYENREKITAANKSDIERSTREGLSSPLLKRLLFDGKKILAAAEGIKSLIRLPDPVGRTLESTELDRGLELFRVSCPIGVIGIIFESRPDALVQISTLCLKSGNSVLLKGGSEARETNRILSDIILEASIKAKIPGGWLSLLETRADVNEMLKLDKNIDLIIPRGSNEFVRYIMDNSRIPVLGHAEGICHCYVDSKASIDMAVKIIIDSKTQYAAVCNALETLLVHRNIAEKLLPPLKNDLEKRGVELFGCEKTRKVIDVDPVPDGSWNKEYLDYKLSIRIVENIHEAIEHINTYGSGHTDSIVTSINENAELFMNLVDSANVFMNCSTRFSDGYRYGLGAEVGISTNKIHARGPVGLEGLVIYKYRLIGNGQIVDDYASGRKNFTHKKLDKNFTL